MSRPALLTILSVLFITGSGILAYRSLAPPGVEIVLPTSTAVKAITVAVVGAVAQPGPYTLGAGQRLQDAITAAGGVTPEADLSGVNLAAHLRDGQQVRLPRKGEPVVMHDGIGRINLNTASADILAILPGIGEVRARRIVEHRLQHGLFGRIEDLVELRLVPASVLEEVRERLIVQ